MMTMTDLNIIFFSILGCCVAIAIPVCLMLRKLGDKLGTDIAGMSYVVSFILFLLLFTFAGSDGGSGNRGVDFFGGILCMLIGAAFLMWPVALFPSIVCVLRLRKKAG